MGGPPAYPWSDPYHDFDKHHYVTLELDDVGGKPGGVVFELGKDIVRPTLDALERRTGRKVIVGTLGACAAYKGRDACGWGSPAELKGRTKIFIDTTGSPEPNQATPILAAIEDARLGVTMVSSASDADIILAFRCAPGTKFLPSKTEPQTRAVGEVYVSQGGTLRVLLLFDQEWFYWKPKLPVKFAREVVKAYKAANGLR
jgi:hypothetical protein